MRLALALVLLVGCHAPTTVLVRFTAPVPLDTLTAQIALGSGQPDDAHTLAIDGAASGSFLVPIDSNEAVATSVTLVATSGSASYSANGTTTSKPEKEVELDLTLGATASFPRLGSLSFADPMNYDDAQFQIDAAKRNFVVLAYYPGWQGGSSMTLDEVIASIKSQSKVGTRVFTYLNNRDEISDPTTSGTFTYPWWEELNTQEWWLYAIGTMPPIVRAYGSTDYGATNTSTFVPANTEGKTWNSYNVDFNYAFAITGDAQDAPTPNLDGFEIGNVYAVSPNTGDWNRDGTADESNDPTIVSAFEGGTKAYVDYLRTVWPSTTVMFGIGDFATTTAPLGVLDQLAQGGTTAGFIGPNDVEQTSGFDAMMTQYHTIMNALAPPKLFAFGYDSWSAGDYQGMRYGLGSCLMDDGYFDINDGTKSLVMHALWFDEFDANLGVATQPPQTSAWSQGVWRRDFENGIALVNPKGNGAQTVTLGGTFKKLTGTQDPAVNDGSTVTSVMLLDRDGVILLR